MDANPAAGLPHGYPFVHIDTVVELSASSGCGIKNISANSFFSATGQDASLSLPDVLLIEAMAQLSGLVMNFGADVAAAAVLGRVNTMRFTRGAEVGESVMISSFLESSFGDAASFDVEASVSGEIIASGRLTLVRQTAPVQATEVRSTNNTDLSDPSKR